ncbi:MAG: LYR motif-containing protein [Rickettsia endosymbiont of Pentastiridius leporinus]
MKEIDDQLKKALSSMKEGVLDCTNLEEVSLQEIFNFLQNPDIVKDKIISCNISTYENWKEVNDFILQLNVNSSFKPQTITVYTFSRYIEDIFNLRLKTGINITSGNYVKTTDHRKEALLKKILEEFKKNNFNTDEEQLSQFIKAACKEAKTPDGIEMQYGRALRIGSEYNFSKIDEQYSDLQSIFKKLQNTQIQEVKSEIHHYKQEDDLHFYMVKVNGANISAWQDFLNKQSNLQKSYKGNDPVIKNFDMGKHAFSSSLNYYDQDLTDVYAAFVSNKIWQKDNSFDPLSIEMFITMLTSQNASFISHSGIARAPIYTLKSTPKHPNLAVKLHSFIAACAKDIYSNKKEYMITVPVIEMTQIILKEYEKKGVLDKIYIGHQDIEISLIPLKDLKLYSEEAEKTYKTDPTVIKTMAYDRYCELFLNYILKSQQENLGNKQIPIKLINDNGKTLLNLYDKNGSILHKLTAEQMEGEFAWFCAHPYLFKHYPHSGPFVTCDLQTLAALDPNPIEHEYYSEIIGNTIT